MTEKSVETVDRDCSYRNPDRLHRGGVLHFINRKTCLRQERLGFWAAARTCTDALILETLVQNNPQQTPQSSKPPAVLTGTHSQRMKDGVDSALHTVGLPVKRLNVSSKQCHLVIRACAQQHHIQTTVLRD